MKRLVEILFVAFAALMTFSCLDEISHPDSRMKELVFSASIQPETRTILSEGNEVLWLPGDQISVNQASEPFLTDIDQMSVIADFEGSAEPSDTYWAVYPYSLLKTWYDTYAIVKIPQEQIAMNGSFADDLNISAACTTSDDMFFRFRNVLGYVKFTLSAESGTVRSVRVRAIGGEPLAGEVQVEFSDESPYAAPSDNSQSYVTLSSETTMEPGNYYIAMLPGTYSSGLEFTFENDEGLVAYKIIDSELSLSAGQIRNIGEVEGLDFGESLEIQQSRERKALIAIYNALGGDNWTRNENWCSDKPVGEWFGINVDADGFVEGIWLSYNNLCGELPAEIAELTRLRELILPSNEIDALPEQLGNLSELRMLNISDAKIESLPFSLLSFPNLEYLQMQDIAFTTFPSEVFQLVSLKELGYLYQPISPLLGNLINLESLTLGRVSETTIPVELFNCVKLKYLAIDGLCVPSYTLKGSIPSEISRLKDLETLRLSNAEFTGGIPESLSELSKMTRLFLRTCNIGGEFPSDLLVKMSGLKQVSLEDNGFTGKVSEEFSKTDLWKNGWRWICIGNDLDLDPSILYGPVPGTDVFDIDGALVDFEKVYAENKYTILFNWASWCPSSDSIMDMLVDVYSDFHEEGVEIIGIYSDSYAESRALLQSKGALWRNIEMYGFNDYTYCLEAPYVGILDVVDNTGHIVYNHIDDNPYDLPSWLSEQLNPADPPYESVDYSSDGKVTVLQTASKGNGIDIVLLGDGYSDRQISDGTYVSDMEYLYENLFMEEPFKSYKDMFNVYYVNVVSATEGYEYGDTALEGYFGEGTLVGGNDNTCFEYAQNAIGAGRVNEALIIVAMNSDAYAGTCYMYYSSSMTGTHGSGPSVSYFPKGSDESVFAQLLHHEACGHGFAKLADEYSYDYMGEIPSPVADEHRNEQNDWGWWKNVDFTGDVTKVRWANLIEDERYANEGLGAYEGGLTYWTGVWRPTENSIMRYNTGGFNAPSREAIYYRIHKLAYGDDWEYDYEKFVEYDAVNRAAAAAGGPQKRRANYVEKQYEPLHPPVVVGKTWREAR